MVRAGNIDLSCCVSANRRFSVALAMRHRLCGLSTYGLNGLEREMSTPPTLQRGTADFTFFTLLLRCLVSCVLAIVFMVVSSDMWIITNGAMVNSMSALFCLVVVKVSIQQSVKKVFC